MPGELLYKNIANMEAMYGFSPKVEPRTFQMLSVLMSEMSRVGEMAANLPLKTSTAVSRLLQTFLGQIAKADFAINDFENSSKDALAAEFMSEKFGPISTPIKPIVKVFEDLANSAVASQKNIEPSAREMQLSLEEVQGSFVALSTVVFDGEIEKLEDDVENHEKAKAKVSSVEVGTNMKLKKRASDGADNMKSKARFLKAELRTLRAQKANWLEFLLGLTSVGKRATALAVAA